MISNNFRKFILIFSLIGVTTSMMSQELVTSIDSTSIFIGQEITYKLEIHSETLAQIKFPKSESFTFGDTTLFSDSKKIEVKLVEVDTSRQGLYEIKPNIEMSKLDIFLTRVNSFANDYMSILILILILILFYIYRDKIFRKKEFKYEKSPYQKAKDEINLISKSVYTLLTYL